MFGIYEFHFEDVGDRVMEYVNFEVFRTYEGADQYRHSRVTNTGWIEDHWFDVYVEPITNLNNGKQWGARTHLRGQS